MDLREQMDGRLRLGNLWCSLDPHDSTMTIQRFVTAQHEHMNSDVMDLYFYPTLSLMRFPAKSLTWL